jgi:glycosyltransferase involved in cell wall biosynthesis
LPEVVADGVTGLLHRAHDAGALREALRRALADPARNAAWGQAARREYQARFTPEVGLAALVDGYRSAIGSAPSPAGQGAPTLPVR